MDSAELARRFSNYDVTEAGDVYRKDGLKMKIIHDTDGYCVVNLTDNSHKKQMLKVHRLVAIKYIPTNDYLLTINHKDGNKDNNSVSNLEWMTVSDNLKHSWNVLGRKHFTKKVKNSNGEIFDSLKEAAKQYGSTIQQISNCCTGKSKSSRGLKWEYLKEE